MFSNDEVMREAAKCTGCGFCLSACPVYQTLGVETLASRGRRGYHPRSSQGRVEAHSADRGDPVHVPHVQGMRGGLPAGRDLAEIDPGGPAPGAEDERPSHGQTTRLPETSQGPKGPQARAPGGRGHPEAGVPSPRAGPFATSRPSSPASREAGLCRLSPACHCVRGFPRSPRPTPKWSPGAAWPCSRAAIWSSSRPPWGTPRSGPGLPGLRGGLSQGTGMLRCARPVLGRPRGRAGAGQTQRRCLFGSLV